MENTTPKLGRGISTRLLSYCVILYALHINPALASETEMVYSPAEFGRDNASIVSRLQIPDNRKNETYKLIVTCQAIINRDGTANNPNCIAPEHYEYFADALLEAVEGAVFVPARIEGSPVQVLMNFMALIHCVENADCKVFLIPNHGNNISEFGLAYTSPQPVLDAKSWYSEFEQKLEWTASGKTFVEVGGVHFMVSTVVDESGEASSGRVEYAVPRKSYKSWAKKAADSLQTVRYIPGYYRTQPTRMRVYEYWVDPNGRLSKTINRPSTYRRSQPPRRRDNDRE